MTMRIFKKFLLYFFRAVVIVVTLMAVTVLVYWLTNWSAFSSLLIVISIAVGTLSIFELAKLHVEMEIQKEEQLMRALSGPSSRSNRDDL